jgi:hypothetical protein
LSDQLIKTDQHREEQDYKACPEAKPLKGVNKHWWEVLFDGRWKR